MEGSFQEAKAQFQHFAPKGFQLEVYPSGGILQILVSGPQGLNAGKESRILASSIAQRWPKTLLYHSGDLPLEVQKAGN